jgi:hypothetical protein
MCHILPPYTLVPLHSLGRLICLVHQVDDGRRVHLMNLTLAHPTVTYIIELSAAHRTVRSSATAAGRFYPYIQFHRRTGKRKRETSVTSGGGPSYISVRGRQSFPSPSKPWEKERGNQCKLREMPVIYIRQGPSIISVSVKALGKGKGKPV